MRLERLRVDRLPGLNDPFTLEPGPGVNLILGPNAVGKSSVARAVRGLFWPEREGREGHLLTARFVDTNGEWDAARSGALAVLWSRDGAPTPAPTVPGDHLADAYRLSAVDLLVEDAGATDQALAAEIRRAMTGGVDLDGLIDAVGAPHKASATQLAGIWIEAEGKAREVGRQQRELATAQAGLAAREERLEEARGAGRLATALGTALDLDKTRRAATAAAANLATFPAAMVRLSDRDADIFADRLREEATKTERIQALDTRLAKLAGDREALGASPRELDDALARLEARIVTCRRAAAELTRAETGLAAAESTWQEARGALVDPAALSGDDLPDDDAFDDLIARHRTALGAAARSDALDDLKGKLGSAPLARGGMVAAIVGLLGAVLSWLAAATDLAPTPWRWPLVAAGAAIAILGAATWARSVRGRQRAAVLEDLERQRGDIAVPEPAGPWTLGRTLDEGGWLRDLDALRHAADRRADRQAAAGAAEAAREEVVGHLEAWSLLVAPWGEPAPSSTAEADAQLALLHDRRRRLTELAEQEHAAGEERAAADADRAESRRQREELLARLDLPLATSEPGPVRTLVDRLPDWGSAAREAERQQNRVADLASTLAEAGQSDLLELPVDELEQRLGAAESLADDEPRLQEELAQLRVRLADAQSSDQRARALADAARGRDILADWRDEARGQAVRSALLTELREAHDEIVTPPQLDEAARLFHAFTCKRHGLTVAPGPDGPVFKVQDHHTGHWLDLTAISDGTRAQLLLAVRLAFLAHMETGVRPPLFLDESLTTADSPRLDAIVRALGELAGSTGRQVFYLTSQPDDVAAWRGALAGHGLDEPTVLDLMTIRNRGVTAGPDELAPRARQPLPVPDTLDLAAYGQALGVRRFDPREGWALTDTFHLASPDQKLIGRLREVGLDRAGILARDLDAGTGLLDDAAAVKLAGALTVLRGFVETWRVGRPRPLTAEDIDTSGAVSAKMRPAVVGLMESVDGNGQRFMARLRAGDVKRFQTDKMDALEDHLREVGALEDASPFDDGGLLHEVQRRIARLPMETRTPPGDVRALVDGLLAAIPPGIAAAPSSRRSSGSGPTS